MQTKWTDEKVKALKPRKRAIVDGVETWVDIKEQRLLVAPGLYIFVRRGARGISKQWQYRAQVHGKRKWMSVGAYPQFSLSDARAEQLRLDQIRRAARNGDGDHPALAERNKRQKAKESHTVATAWVEYLASLSKFVERTGKPARPRTIENLSYMYQSDIGPMLADRRLAFLDSHIIRSVIDRPINRGSLGAANQIWKTLRAFLTWARDQEYIEADPMRGIRNPKPYRPKRPTGAADDEIEQFLRAIYSSEMSPPTRIAFELCLLTGMRPGEVRNLRWKSVDLEKRRISLSEDDTKMHTQHAVHLSRAAIPLIREAQVYAGNGEYLFPGKNGGRPLAKNSLHQALRRSYERSGSQQSKLKPHDLRKLFRTLCSKLKVHQSVAERCLNHQLDTLTKAYDGYDYWTEQVDAWETVGAHVAAIRDRLKR